jgi:hypothetical protein
MPTTTKKLDLRTATGAEIAAASRPGVIAALRAHKKAGVPAVIWDHVNQKTVLVPPEEIPDFLDELPEEPAL